jgi:hypothetical protein
MNGNVIEVYASKMMLLMHQYQLALWADVPHCWQWYSLPTHWLVVGWDDFTSLVLLELKSLEEVNKYSSLASSSLLVVKLISVERMDSAFLCALHTAWSCFRYQLPFKYMNFFEKNKEGLRILSRSIFGFKESLFLVFKFGNCSEIIRVVVVLVTIVTPHVGHLMILRRLTYNTGSRNSFLIIYW